MKLTWVDIDLSALIYNLKQIKKLVGEETKIQAVVKADAYGHGAIEVARSLVGCGVRDFAVAELSEGQKLRDSGINQTILLLQPPLSDSAEEVIKYNLIPTVCTLDFARQFNQLAKSKNRIFPVHIKVDTGMGRLGVPFTSFWKFVKEISNLKNLRIDGVFSHFAKAYCDEEFSKKQLSLFQNLIQQSRKKGIFIPHWHIANSAAILDLPNSYFQLVRPGIMLYGLYPSSAVKNRKKISLKPVMSLKSRIIYSKEVSAGTGLSYGHTYFVQTKATIVTLPIGYSHGYSRNLSNKTQVIFRGRKYPQVGTICMDSLLINLSKAKPKLGEEVVIMGKEGQVEITADTLAEKMGTINYEITCRFGSSCERIYKR